jgi:hypothetical protein
MMPTLTAPAVVEEKTETIGSYTIKGDERVLSHNYFERDLDAPPFKNFDSIESNDLTLKDKMNNGTCYGISMFTIRYFQWFILPSLLSDDELSKVRGKKFILFGKPKTTRKIPDYAYFVAKAMNLPGWMLQWPEGTQKERTAKVAPYRMRTLLSENSKMAEKLEEALQGKSGKSTPSVDPEVAQKQAIRMFDNQFSIFKLATNAGDVISTATHSLLDSENKLVQLFFGRGAFDKIRDGIKDNKKALMEIEFCGSEFGKKFSEFWGHSVVAWKVGAYKAENSKGETVDAYKIHIYDSNDPVNAKDNSFWYFSDEQKFTVPEKYAKMYNFSGSPLLPSGKEFLKPIQMHPASENVLTKHEENFRNVLSLAFEKVSVDD